VSVLNYDEAALTERELSDLTDLLPSKDEPTVTWINVNGLHDTQIMEDFGKHFGLHPLLLEDVVNTQQRPKLEAYENCLFVVLKMLSWDEKSSRVDSEQVSLVLGPRYVISFQERSGNVFEPVRKRIGSRKGRICRMGPDYLIYAMVDAIVDHYFLLLERIGDEIEALEKEVFQEPADTTLRTVQHLKSELLHIRRSIWPLREVAGGMMREESDLISEQTHIFWRDVYDHTIQVIDTLESYRDTSSGLLDIYLSSVSNRMNEVMKVLTIIATIFIPLTFIAGIYGMNFEWMPELHQPWAYPAVWIVMVFVALLMVMYFRRKKWF
jgi:magnesium transporter